jgi:hypothetical protein
MLPSTAVDVDGPEVQTRAPQLARELSDFLIELAIAMHKHAIYPPGHPLLVQTVDAVNRALLELLALRPALSIGVARRQLIIEGVATESGHPLLSELAGKLHHHHIGALKFLRGVTRDELSDALGTIGVQPRRDEQPIGLQPALLAHRWANVKLFPLTYDRLELLKDDDETEASRATGMRDGRAAQLWVGLARAALAGDRREESDGDSTDSLEPSVVARAIDEHGREQAYDQVIVGYMLQIADEVRRSGPSEGAGLKRRISRLVGSLQPQTLLQLLDMGGDHNQRRRFVLDAAQGMNVDAVVELVQAAGKAEGQTISHSLVRMLTKLASHASETDTRRGVAADGALREHVVRLVSDWSLDDPNPQAYSAMLERMSRDGDTISAEFGAHAALPCEPVRLLEIALELDVAGDPVTRAAAAMVRQGSLSTLVDLLDTNQSATNVTAAIWQTIVAANPLPALLAAPQPDLRLVQRLVQRLGLRALPALLDALAIAREPARREQIMLRILALGPSAAPIVAERLAAADDAHARDLLTVIGRLTPPTPPFQARTFLAHSDALLRREAVRLLLGYDDTREAALLAAVRDDDTRVVSVGLLAAQDACSGRIAAAIRQRLDRGELQNDIMRAAAVRAIAAAPTPGRADDDLVQWLMSKVLRPSRVLRGPRIAAPTAELCAALSVLAARWSNDSRVRPLLQLARVDEHDTVRKAAVGPTGATTPRGAR